MKDINLAYKLEDGMKIYIPTNQEKEEEMTKNQNKSEEQEYITTSSGVSEDKDITEEVEGEKVNINKATQSQLETLPGVGPSTAKAIIEYRSENGEFKKIEDIKEVRGIGEAKFQKMKDYIVIK